MATGKRFYWIKLKNTFMTSDAVDFLMSQPDGANYVVLYQMLCLKTINTGGRLERHIGEVIIPYDEAKIQRDTKWFSIDTVRVALKLYQALGLIYMDQDGCLTLANYNELVGSETDYANQKKLQRQNKLPELPVDNVHTDVHTDVHENVHTEKDIRERDKRLEKDTRDREDNTPPTPPKGARRFTPPTLEEVKAYCAERGGKVDAENWYDWYSANGWKVGKNPMKDWKAAVRTWERGDRGKPEKKPKYTKNGMPIEVGPLEGGDDLDSMARLFEVQS